MLRSCPTATVTEEAGTDAVVSGTPQWGQVAAAAAMGLAHSGQARSVAGRGQPQCGQVTALSLMEAWHSWQVVIMAINPQG
jgi:hypothetical protein